MDIPPVATRMAGILGTMVVMLAGIVSLQKPAKADSTSSSFLPDPNTQPSKYAYEKFVAVYTPVWSGVFGAILVFELYEQFDAFLYNTVLLTLALPLVLQPIFYPSAGFNSPDSHRGLWDRYATKVNVWIAVYSFIVNYSFTHYFYSVLKAEFTMPSTRLNNVPICMFFATHFYFSSYHLVSNMVLRKVVTTYEKGPMRTLLYSSVVLVFAYFTAFMETLSISSFPYYRFEDRDMAYTVGSAFYGIYFLVSFPAVHAFDDDIDNNKEKTRSDGAVTVWDAVVSSFGHGMVILILLDLVRLYLDIPLVVGVLP